MYQAEEKDSWGFVYVERDTFKFRVISGRSQEGKAGSSEHVFH